MKKITALLLTIFMLCTFAISASAAVIQETEEIKTMTREIPEGAFLYKEGLYIYESSFVWNGTTRYTWELYSAEGWCFYDLQIPENYDEEGNLKPASERLYAQYSVMAKNEQYVTDYIIPVPVEDGYEIVSVGGGTVTQ